ncbi:aminotransferase class V-fold PLP-dependent enzyme [Nonomuraea wenchangensis]|uniref:Cysteine desulfurase n=1 Tax=Nonomuraea wenchangensis TaxID=568860 RepID=A0A1I0L8M5_9ACTN|nr:aminotransferase class V-fold PLP-dependent enzyme [Nonomuraea wenchangensis]SEU36363.1 cysteine desulfurase [Nonomuraea wenchangensis]
MTRAPVDPAALAAALEEETVPVSVMAANNETGALQPLSDLAALAHEHGALPHCHAAQAVGKITVDVEALGVDLLTVVGHKMYAPKGIAALYVCDGVKPEPVVHGGGQERGLRRHSTRIRDLAEVLHAARPVPARPFRVAGRRGGARDQAGPGSCLGVRFLGGGQPT